MYYWEYATAAQIHYKSIKHIFEASVKKMKDSYNNDILYRIYYLCGHVIECAAVYLIYNHFRWKDNQKCKDWKGEDENIHLRYNIDFTMDSHMHFYPLVRDGQTLKPKSGTMFSLKFDEKEGEYFNVQKHEFQKYIKGIIQVQLPLEDVPYFRPSCPEDNQYKQAIVLLDNWNSDLRYYYENRNSGYFNKNSLSQMDTLEINTEAIEQLLTICEKIVNKLPSGKQIK